MSLEQNLDNLFERIAQVRKEPNHLKLYIQDEALQDIYNYLLTPSVKEEILEQLRDAQATGKPVTYRIQKSSQTCARTLNILQDINGELVLIVETKSKLANGEKREASDFDELKGAHKKGIPCWRIDCYPPVKWINLRAISTSKRKQKNMINEAVRSQEIALNAVMDGMHNPINYYLLGQVRVKDGVCQQSIYSPMAPKTLQGLLEEKLVLSKREQDRIAHDILLGIYSMHRMGYIHQDIKPANTLLELDIHNGQYRAKIADFGATCLKATPIRPSATLCFESPEISQFYYFSDKNNKKDSVYYDYFHCQANSEKSAGRIMGLQRDRPSKEVLSDYAHPDPANDIWSIGITLYLVYGQDQPDYIAKMLMPREERCSIQEAMSSFQQLPFPLAMPLEVHPPVAIESARAIDLMDVEPCPASNIFKLGKRKIENLGEKQKEEDNQPYLPAYRENAKRTKHPEKSCLQPVRKIIKLLNRFPKITF